MSQTASQTVSQITRPLMADDAHPFLKDGRWLWEQHYPPGIDWRAALKPSPIFSFLDEAAVRFPTRAFYDFSGKRVSYSAAQKLVNRIAMGLQGMGVKKGVKVGLFLPNTPYSILFHYGILKAGGTVVNYNPLYVERELKSQIDDSETEILVTTDTPMLFDKVQNLLPQTGLKKVIVCPVRSALPFPKNLLYREGVRQLPLDGRHIWYKDIINNSGNFVPVAVDLENDIAVLQYTGGTTGVPKGAMLTHASISMNVEQLTLWTSPSLREGTETIICVLPLFHVFAMTAVMHCAVKRAMTIVLHPKFDVNDVLKSIEKHRPTVLHGVPAIFNALATHARVRDYDFSSLRFCITGGAPMPQDVHRLFEDKTGCGALREGYGLTETSPGVTFNPAVGDVKPGSVGLPVPGTIVDIVCPETGNMLGPGEKGEVCIRGPQVMKGYYRKKEETAGVLKNGRLHTGDVGIIDEGGYLSIVDRIKDLIIVRGYNVYPRMVEEAIYLHPGVEECIVAGVPDDARGESVWAWVKRVAGKDLTESDLQAFLEDKISAIERPRKIIIRDTPLPKTAVGKLSKKDLLAQESIARR